MGNSPSGFERGLGLQTLDIDFKTSSYGKSINFELPASLWIASIEYWINKFQFSAEYSKWYMGLRVNNAEVPIGTAISERQYVMANYRLTEWLHPGIYYSLYYPSIDNRKGNANQLYDLAAFIRFDINSHWLLKLEGHFMHGTAMLNSALNNNTSIRNLSPNWGAFIIKTTGYF